MADEHPRHLVPGAVPHALPASESGIGMSPRELAAGISPTPSGTRSPKRRRRLDSERHPVFEAWQASTTAAPEFRVAEPPEPTVGELQAAAAERNEYFAHLNRRLRGEPSGPPEVRLPAYWGCAGG